MAVDSDLVGVLLDVGLTRITLTDGAGILEAVTASAGSRFGQRVTFAVSDETHLWVRGNGGVRLPETIRRSASKMNGRTFESTNAHALGEGSVAELTHQAAGVNSEVLYAAVEAPEVADLADLAAVPEALKVSYGEAARERGGWLDLDRIARDIADPSMNPDDARRFHFNQVRLGSTAFDVGAWARPPGASAGWRIPRPEVHAAVAAAFARWDVGLFYADPPKWYSELDEWTRLYGDPVVALDTNQAHRFAPLCDQFAVAIGEGNVSHDGAAALTSALAASARRNVRLRDDPDDGRTRFTIMKADTRKIDRAVAAVLAHGASRALPAPPRRAPIFAY